MRKTLILIFLLTTIFFNFSVYAQEKPTPTSTVDEVEIQDFKDKIASKVAELQEKDQKSIAGFVIKNEKTQISIKSEDKQSYLVKIDDILTKAL